MKGSAYKAVAFLGMLLFGMGANAQILYQEIPDKVVVLTFDDATASQYSTVAPMLKEFGFGATFYVCEFPPNFSDSSKYMNWRQIRELDRMGFEIANHTQSHPMLNRLEPEQILQQISYIERKCDSMGIAGPVTFAYPGYGLDARVLEILQSKEYLFARAGGDRPYDPLVDHPLLIPSWAMTSGNREQVMEAFHEAKGGKIVVLTIHGVPDEEHPWVTTSPPLFREYLQYLYDNHYKVIAMRDLAEYINASEALKKPVTDLNADRGD